MKKGKKGLSHTLDSIKALCEIDDDCWVWTRCVSKQGIPRTKHESKTWNVRRLVYTLNGRSVRAGYTPIPVKCGNPACVNPAHLAERDIAKHVAEHNKARSMTVKTKAKVADQRRQKSHLTWELVNKIRSSDKTIPQLVKELNLKKTTIRQVANYTRWKDYSTPWAGLMA